MHGERRRRRREASEARGGTSEAGTRASEGESIVNAEGDSEGRDAPGEKEGESENRFTGSATFRSMCATRFHSRESSEALMYARVWHVNILPHRLEDFKESLLSFVPEARNEEGFRG